MLVLIVSGYESTRFHVAQNLTTAIFVLTIREHLCDALMIQQE